MLAGVPVSLFCLAAQAFTLVGLACVLPIVGRVRGTLPPFFLECVSCVREGWGKMWVGVWWYLWCLCSVLLVGCAGGLWAFLCCALLVAPSSLLPSLWRWAVSSWRWGGDVLAVLWLDPVACGERSCVGWCAGALVVRSSLCEPILAVVQMDKR